MSQGNTSPLLRRTTAAPLSLAMLTELVPIVQRGVEAQDVLLEIEEGRTSATRETLIEIRRTVREGKKAQESLIISALPLIKEVVKKEVTRRKAWNSRVPLEDVLQEAIIGFIKGLKSYKVEAQRSSATNYLMQWVSTTVRRQVEALEHDFSIPYETIERTRRIIAVKSRVATELGREPTDEELLDALNDPEQVTQNKWGRVANKGKPRQLKFTQAHLEVMAQLSDKLYSLGANETTTESGEESGTVEKAAVSITSATLPYQETVEYELFQDSRRKFIIEALTTMEVKGKQQDIIFRFFGLQPYDDAQTLKQIAEELNLPHRTVKQVTLAFSQYMSQVGGAFHRVITRMDPADLSDLEFDWLIERLGDWPEGLTNHLPPPSILLQYL